MKKVLVTGGTRGIGRAITEAFARRGYEVAFCYCRGDREAEELCRQYRDHNKIFGIKADLSTKEGIKDCIRQVKDSLGEVDILINNAGVSSYSLIQDVDETEFDRVFNTNFRSVFFLSRNFSSEMIRNQRGCILNISSVWGQTGASCEVLYSATKAAVIGFTKALAKELAPSGISVNCIAPGIVDTEMMDRFSQEEKDEMRSSIPTGQFVTPDQIADMAVFLAEREDASLTGQVIAMNGGMFC